MLTFRYYLYLWNKIYGLYYCHKNVIINPLIYHVLTMLMTIAAIIDAITKHTKYIMN